MPAFCYLTQYMTTLRHLPKQLLTFALCLGIRLIPFRPANAEPLMATLMPQATRFGMLQNLLWITASMVIYDLATVGIGPWTWETAFAYGLVSIAASYYFKRHQNASRRHYVGFSVVAILFYDFLTGIVFGPLFNDQLVSVALAGQIPFTLAHLSAGFLTAAFLSPVIKKWIVDNPALELAAPERTKAVTN